MHFHCTGEKAILLVKNFEIVCARGVKWHSSSFSTHFLRIVVLDRRKIIKSVFLEIHGILYMKKVTEFRGISRNYSSRNSAEFRRNFSQFRTKYGIDGSKKNRRNSVSMEFRGHPTPDLLQGGDAEYLAKPGVLEPLPPTFS